MMRVGGGRRMKARLWKPRGPTIVLDNTSIAENAANGTVIGNLSMRGTPADWGTTAFTVTYDPGGLGAISGGALDKNGTLDYEAAQSFVIGVTATPSGPYAAFEQRFTINVTNVAPVLSNPTDTKTGQTTATITVDTTETTGTLYWVVTTSGTAPTAAQIKAGKDNSGVTAAASGTQAITTTGTKTVSVTGLTAATAYTAHFMHEENGSSQSNVSSGNGFTTDSAATLLLDGITNVTLAFSFRKLVTAYSGNCVTIRESGGNTEQSFGFTAGNVVDDAAIVAFIGGGNNGFISKYFDQSGNGLDLTEATHGNQAQYISSGINSLPIARMAGTQGGISASVALSSIMSANQGTFIYVWKPTSTVPPNTVFRWDPGATQTSYLNSHVPLQTLDIYFDFGTGGAAGRVHAAPPGGFVNNAHVIEMWRTTGNVQAVSIDGTSLVSSAGMTDTLSGSAAFHLGDQDGIIGDLAEFIMIKVDTGAPNRQIIRKDGISTGVAQGAGPYYGITVA